MYGTLSSCSACATLVSASRHLIRRSFVPSILERPVISAAETQGSKVTGSNQPKEPYWFRN